MSYWVDKTSQWGANGGKLVTEELLVYELDAGRVIIHVSKEMCGASKSINARVAVEEVSCGSFA